MPQVLLARAPRLRNYESFNVQVPSYKPLFAQAESYTETFAVTFECLNAVNWGKAIGLCSVALAKADVLNRDWIYPVGRAMNLDGLHFYITGAALSKAHSKKIQTLLKTERRHCDKALWMQWDILQALYTCNLKKLEQLFPAIQSSYASNTLFSMSL